MTPLWSLTATELVQLIQRGDVSARDVTESTLSRIDAVNAECNAIVARCDDEALAAADAIDAARAQGLDTGPMAGVPITIKVNTDQVGHATTNGLRRQRDLVEQDRETEFAEACRQVERIAELRLIEKLGA